MSLLLYASFADSSCPLGRLDYSLLSHQALMEIVIQGAEFNPPNLFEDDDGNFLDIDDWETIALDGKGKVVIIEFIECFGKGTLDFEAIPQTVTKLEVGVTLCTGEIPFGKLYNEIRFMSVYDSGFYGSVDLTEVPRQLIRLTLSSSNFSGTLDFSNLPPNLIALDLGDNSFTGHIDITYITRNICEDNFQHFELQYYNRDAPEGMDFGIDLSQNKFEGDILVGDLETVTDEGQFRGNKSQFIIDAKGGNRALEQFIAEEDVAWDDEQF